jgi:hypothetical protein
MALTKITANIIEDGAISTSSLADTSITADKLHTTLDLTGKSVTVATATAGDNDTTVASTAFVSTAIANLADSAPSTLDTLNELAAALGDDANFSTTVTNSIATKLPLAGGTMTGTIAGFTSTGIDDNATSTAITIDSSGNLLVGKTTVGVGNAGIELRANNMAAVSRSGDNVLYLNRITDNGSILEFRKDNVAVGNISVVNDDRMVFATADGLGLQFDKDNNRIVPCDATGAYNNNVELGDSTLEFTNLWLSGTASIGNLTIAGAQGTDGQVLTSTGSGIAWEDAASGGVDGIVSSANATAITIDSAETIFHKTTSPTLHSAVTGIVFTNGSLLTDSTRIDGGSMTLAQNAAVDSGNTWAYLAAGEASYYQQFNGNHYFTTAASGTAGADATMSTLMTIASGGNVGIGTTSPSKQLTVSGDNAEFLLNRTGGYADTINMGAPSGIPTIVGGTHLAFGGSGAWTEHMRITSSGNVGIGTTSPSTELHVYSADQNALKIQTNTGINQIELANSTNSPTYLTQNSYGFELKVDENGWGGSNSFFAVKVKAAERMRINSAGQTLINTTDGNMPTAGGNADCVIYGGAGNGFAYNALHVGGGRISLNAQPNSNSTRGYIECSGGGFKIWHVDNSDMIFGVNDSEKMRIQYSDGRIRSQPTYDNTAPATHRDVYVENSGQLGYASSVRAHKTNINSYGDASWLYQIDPKTFNYRKPNTTLVTNDDGFTEEVRDGTYSDTEYYDTVEVGFIAEDVEEHDPNLCFYNEVEDEDGNVTNELAGIHYKSMVVPMLKLIKEQKTLIDNLTARITELEG